MCSQLSDPHAVIVTNCTTRKRQGVPLARFPSTKSVQTIEQLASAWIGRVNNVKQPVPASDLYLGRSIVDARQAATTIGAELYVASAGLGLVHHADPVPSYNVTVSGGDGSIGPFLIQRGQQPRDWWGAVNTAKGKRSALAKLVSRIKVDVVYLALPSNYLSLIAGELDSLADRDLKKLRIFTSSFGRSQVPSRLNGAVMPYDDRLEALVNYRGTRADFPQRAMLHFIEALKAQSLDQSKARSKVKRSLAPLDVPILPERISATDLQLDKLIRKYWKAADGRSAELLRCLRDDALVRCEQSRFRRLWSAVKAEKQSRVGGR